MPASEKPDEGGVILKGTHEEAAVTYFDIFTYRWPS